MSFSIKSGMQNSKMEWKPKPEVVFRAILVKNQISRFSRPRISMIRRPIDQSTGDALDHRCGAETKQLRPGEPTPITLSVVLKNRLQSHQVHLTMLQT